jgi:hypothetical protein
LLLDVLTIIGTFSALKCHLKFNPDRSAVDCRQRSNHMLNTNLRCIFNFLKMIRSKLYVILNSFIRKRAEIGIIV